MNELKNQKKARHLWLKNKVIWTLLVIVGCLVVLWWGTPLPAAPAQVPEALTVKMDPKPQASEKKELSRSEPLPAYLIEIEAEIEELNAQLTRTRSILEKTQNRFAPPADPAKEEPAPLPQATPPSLTEKEHRFLAKLADWYGLGQDFFLSQKTPPEIFQALGTLIEKVGPWPKLWPLTVAYAQPLSQKTPMMKAHNFLGISCYKKGCGQSLVENWNIELQEFSHWRASLEAFYKQLNTLEEFGELRKLRNLWLEKKELDLNRWIEVASPPQSLGLWKALALVEASQSLLKSERFAAQKP